MVIIDGDVDGTYVAACISTPEDFADLNVGNVTFNASTTKAIIVNASNIPIVTEIYPADDPTRFSWFWEFFMPGGHTEIREFVHNSSSLAYYFGVEFPTPGDNSATLRVDFE